MYTQRLLTFSGLIFVSGVLALGANPKEIKVDCAHKTISDAVTGLDNDKEYLVTVTGVCNENVLITDFQGIALTVQGNPTATINGVSGNPFGVPVVQIVNSRRVSIQNFTINATGALPLGNNFSLAT